MNDRELREAVTDTVRIAILDDKGWKIIETDPQAALPFIQEAHDLAKQIDNKRWIVNTYIGLSHIQHNLGNFDGAQKINFETLEVAKQMKSRLLIASCFGNIGLEYSAMGDFPKAMDYQLKALKVYEELGDVRNLAYMNTNMADFFYRQKDPVQAQEYSEKALKLFRELKDSSFIGLGLANLSSILYELKKHQRSLDLTLEALEIKKRMQDSVGMAHCYQNMANAYYVLEHYDLALKFGELAIRIFTRSNKNYYASLAYLNLANVYLDLKEYPKAIKSVEKGSAIANSIKAYDMVLFGYEIYINIYKAQKNYQEELKYTKLKIAMDDSIFSAEKSKQIKTLEIKYGTEKKEKEISELTQQTKIQQLEISRNWLLTIGLVILAVLILVLAIVVLRQNKLKANQNKIEVEQKLFRSQMNPHFIFNALIAIQNYVYKHPPAEVAGYIARFAKLMRLTLENSRNELVTIEKEIDSLKYYLELQQLRFENKFDYEIKLDEEMDASSFSIPPMLAQPFIENAIEHGIMNKLDGKGNILVQFTHREKMIELIIEDNGIGIDTSKKQKAGEGPKHHSLATTITEERLALLNKKNKQKFSFSISDLKNDQGASRGTQVKILMPEA
jgi:tetratricopeptide (TPR) repeat protein